MQRYFESQGCSSPTNLTPLRTLLFPEQRYIVLRKAMVFMCGSVNSEAVEAVRLVMHVN